MRYYVWYSPEIDVIVFQVIMHESHMSFEWQHYDMYEHLDWDADIGIESYLWTPLGEL